MSKQIDEYINDIVHNAKMIGKYPLTSADIKGAMERNIGLLKKSISELEDENNALKAENAELEAKAATPKWHTGHPEHAEEVLVYVQYDYKGGEYFREYEVDAWCTSANNWLGKEYNRTVLGWRDCDDFDLPLEVGE